MITFGLKRNQKLRERLFAGTLHGLELVYANDEVMSAAISLTVVIGRLTVYASSAVVFCVNTPASAHAVRPYTS